MEKILIQRDVLIIGSGAAGLAAAVRLHAAGITSLTVCTEGLRMGTSINTGSDKQTYYKLGMYGTEPDSPILLAQDLMSGGSVHGDIALAEAALSQLAFANLVTLGVPFPHDEYGQYIGYKTDHDPKRRATSCGPYTSREMCNALIAEAKRRNIEFLEKRFCIKLTVKNKLCTGAVFLNLEKETPILETVAAKYTIFATGGPGGLYERSVYPAVHTGGIGLALEAGARARNLAESQFGLASTKFRWNVSGSYMQVLPRFISTAADGSGEREFLREYFASAAEMYDAIFLKGYQWPFAAGHVPGSSLVDIYVYIETELRGRRVFLDYRSDPEDFHFEELAKETREYLIRSGAQGKKPLERLKQLNAPAVELYADHAIHLDREPLEIAVCAQHNNGGLAGNMWWESENIRNLFPVGEVNGSHGVTRPGGTALNAGQCGAFRAAEMIAFRLKQKTDSPAVQEDLAELEKRIAEPCTLNWKEERAVFQRRMSQNGAFIRSEEKVKTALIEAEKQLSVHRECALGGLNPRDLMETLRNTALLTAQVCYLEAILTHIRTGAGSRGGAIVLKQGCSTAEPPVQWEIVPEQIKFRNQTLETIFSEKGSVSHWTDCRPLPQTDGWFENVWRDCRTGKLWEEKKENDHA